MASNIHKGNLRCGSGTTPSGDFWFVFVGENELAEGREKRKCWMRFKKVMEESNEGWAWEVKSGVVVGESDGVEG